MLYDVFICHASEDKEDFVRPLAERLRHQHIDVWYDEFSLSIGDSLTQKIDEGLAKSRFGIVVLSPNFFKKPWAKRELKGLVAREMVEDESVILPIWHRVGVNEVLKFSPPLAERKAAKSADGINVVLREIIKKIKPDESPLIVARDYLVGLEFDPPPISDEWWLDIIEYKEFLKFPDLNAGKRWIFPLPCPNEERGRDRGLNIASTALQLDWSFEGEELNISPITHPEKVHSFIHQWPGLFDCAKQNPGVLALYVPQITIPGFDAGFEEVFDELMYPGNKDADRIFSYGSHDTVDGEPALCGDVISLRHPSFGNYTADELGHWYFDGHDMSYYRSDWDIFEGLVWLLSQDSVWLPNNYKQTFLTGILSRDRWADLSNRFENPFLSALLLKTRKQFKFTGTIKKGLEDLTVHAIRNLGIDDGMDSIVKKLMSLQIVKCYYDYRDRLNERRAKRQSK